MSETHSAFDPLPRRRVVLVDFDWLDADLMPELLRSPELDVRLVAGQGSDDAGVRVAELCGVPHTVELSDLTREIFDLALIGERTSRRSHIERFLTALGTPVTSPSAFLAGSQGPPAAAGHVGQPPEAPEGPGADAELADESVPDDGPDLDAALERSLPELGEPIGAGDEAAGHVPHSGPMPGPEDGGDLERTIAHWAATTDATGAQIHVHRDGRLERVCRAGPEDPLLGALVHLALELGRPHVVHQVEGPERGKAWGAWPFRTTVRRACVAAAAIDPIEGRALWEGMVDELRASWDRHDREEREPGSDGAAFGAAGSMRERIAIALESNRRDGSRFEAHRLQFQGPAACVENLCRAMEGQLRDTDRIQLLADREALLLCAGSPSAFALIRRRLMAAWDRAWTANGQSPPAPPFVDERVELLDSLDAERFESIVLGWLPRPAVAAESRPRS